MHYTSLFAGATIAQQPTRGSVGGLVVDAATLSPRGRGDDGLPGELRILNSPSSRADYRLTLPIALRRLRIVVGGDAGRVVTVTAGMRESIDLGKP